MLLTILLIVPYIFLGAFVCLSSLLFSFIYPLELFFAVQPYSLSLIIPLTNYGSTSHPVHPVLSILIIHVLSTCGLAFFILHVIVYIHLSDSN